MAEPEPQPDPRVEARGRFHKIGEWGTLNVLRQHFALTRSAVESRMGEGSDAVDMLKEIPFGGQVTQTFNARPAMGMAGWLAPVVVSAGALAAGYLLANRDPSPPPSPPPPIDAVLEWETVDATTPP